MEKNHRTTETPYSKHILPVPFPCTITRIMIFMQKQRAFSCPLSLPQERMNDYKIYKIIKTTTFFCLQWCLLSSSSSSYLLLLLFLFFFENKAKIANSFSQSWVFAVSCPLYIVQCCIGVYRKSSVIHSILKKKLGLAFLNFRKI